MVMEFFCASGIVAWIGFGIFGLMLVIDDIAESIMNEQAKTPRGDTLRGDTRSWKEQCSRELRE